MLSKDDPGYTLIPRIGAYLRDGHTWQPHWGPLPDSVRVARMMLADDGEILALSQYMPTACALADAMLK